jgi:nucleotide-binding universal stress UspA family protein
MRTAGTTVQTRVVVSARAELAILEAAAAPTDLVALATHGRGGVQRLLLGSVADKVLRGCSTPVLLFRADS